MGWLDEYHWFDINEYMKNEEVKKVKTKFTEQPKQRFPNDRKWKNSDVPQKSNK